MGIVVVACCAARPESEFDATTTSTLRPISSLARAGNRSIFDAVHHHLFQDVYIWAGKPRTVRMSKQGNPFCYPEHIEAQATNLFAELKANDFLENLEPDDFSIRAAHFLSELNVIHAFREGNGRTQLTFFAMLAENAGHPLDLEKLDPDLMPNAMIESFEGNEKELARVI